MISLENKTIVLFGAAGLLGKNFCKLLLESNANLVMADSNAEHLNFLEQSIDSKYKSKILALKCDICKLEDITMLIELAKNKFDIIDAMVNVAYPRAKGYGNKFEDVQYQDFCQNLNIHLGGYFLVAQQMAKFFSQQGHGNIVNFSSIYGVIAPKNEIYQDTSMTMPVEYAAIKSAIIHLTKYIAVYYKSKNIRCNVISPGGIFDNQPESFVANYKDYCLNNGMLAPSDLNSSLLFLLDDSSKFINGQNLIIDDGFTL